MNISSLITDNITEVLVKIVKFTDTRQEILTMNLDNSHTTDYIPKDLDVDGFSELMDEAITEHVLNNRLLLRDNDSIKFGVNGDFQVSATTDHNSLALLKENRNKYIEAQIDKMMENSLNKKIANELLKQKQGAVSIFE
jgi:flagellar basal body rod protein FlgB